jgi:hypothetical protein
MAQGLNPLPRPKSWDSNRAQPATVASLLTLIAALGNSADPASFTTGLARRKRSTDTSTGNNYLCSRRADRFIQSTGRFTHARVVRWSVPCAPRICYSSVILTPRSWPSGTRVHCCDTRRGKCRETLQQIWPSSSRGPSGTPFRGWLLADGDATRDDFSERPFSTTQRTNLV